MYNESNKETIKNLYQWLVEADETAISEIVDGKPVPAYSARAKTILGHAICMLPSFDFVGALDSAKIECERTGQELVAVMSATAFHDDLCELMTDHDMHECLKEHINYSAMIDNYEREQVEERAGWKAMIALDERSRVRDMTSDDFRKEWQS